MRKGMDAHVLGLALGVVVLLVVLAVVVGLNTSGAFRDFLNKVPWLNKIIPDGGDGGGSAPTDQTGQCGGLCQKGSVTCRTDQRCTATPADSKVGICNADPLCGPTGNVLMLYAVPKISGDVYYVIYEDPASTYQIRSGDCLEYDVWINTNAAGIGGVDIKTQPGGKHWWNENNWRDQNGEKASMRPAESLHSSNQDISEFAYRKWYHRKIPVFTDANPDNSMVGKGLEWVRIDFEQDSLRGAPIVAYYDNIKFVNCNNPSDVGKVIFDETLQKNPPIRDRDGGYDNEIAEVVNRGSMTETPDYRNRGTNVLKFVATNPGDKNSVYWKVGDTSGYVFKPGDTIEYDVCIVTNSDQIGGINVRDQNDYWHNIDKPPGPFTSVSCTDEANTWKDQNMIDGDPKCDLRQKDSKTLALNKWYHRIMVVPQEKIGKQLSFIDLAADKEDRLTYEVYYDNIMITNGDRLADNAKGLIFEDSPISNSRDMGIGDPAFTASLDIVAPPPSFVCAPAD